MVRGAFRDTWSEVSFPAAFAAHGGQDVPQGLKSLRESREFAWSPAGTVELSPVLGGLTQIAIVPQGRLKESVMSAVPPGLFVLSDLAQDYGVLG